MNASQVPPTPVADPSARPQRGDEVELEIDTLAFGGAGVARREGYVIFVSGAVPGDRVRATITKRKRSHAEARTLEVLSPGPDRIAPLADHPGVPWQVLSYERQLEIKQGQVLEALSRIGHLEGFESEPIIPAVQTWRYRNKLEYSFGTDAAGGLVLGFHEPGRWDRVVGVQDCLLASELGNQARDTVLAWARGTGLRARDPRSHTGELRNVVVREGRRTGQLQVRLVTEPLELDLQPLTDALEAHSLLWTQTSDIAETTSGGATQVVSGDPQLEEHIGDLVLRLSPGAFLQTNTEMAERLYEVVAAMAGLEGYERVYDLYCGIGTIGLSLAARAGELWGLEVVESAIADAIANASLNEVTNARFFAGDVRTALRELVELAGRPDLVVLDPPRSGLSAKVVRRVIEAAPKRIVYVSCNPTTLAPNAAQLVEAGWHLSRVQTVDMFPQTPHIECVALLERRTSTATPTPTPT